MSKKSFMRGFDKVAEQRGISKESLLDVAKRRMIEKKAQSSVTGFVPSNVYGTPASPASSASSGQGVLQNIGNWLGNLNENERAALGAGVGLVGGGLLGGWKGGLGGALAGGLGGYASHADGRKSLEDLWNKTVRDPYRNYKARQAGFADYGTQQNSERLDRQAQEKGYASYDDMINKARTNRYLKDREFRQFQREVGEARQRQLNQDKKRREAAAAARRKRNIEAGRAEADRAMAEERRSDPALNEEARRAYEYEKNAPIRAERARTEELYRRMENEMTPEEIVEYTIGSGKLPDRLLKKYQTKAPGEVDEFSNTLDELLREYAPYNA